MSILPVLTHEYILVGAPRQFTRNKNVGEFVLDLMRDHGNDVAMIEAASGKSVTYTSLRQEVITLATVLRAKGFGKGDVIGICSENKLEYPVPVLATLAIGATCAPLNPIYTTGELKHAMSISKPSIVFCSPFTAVKLDEVRSSVPSIKEIIVFGEDVESDEKFTSYVELLKKRVNVNDFKCTPIVDGNEDVAVVLCSSGTTGLPKCVELTHTNVLAFLEYIMDPAQSGTRQTDVLLGLIPFFHGYGWGTMLLCLAGKVKIVVMSMFDERQFLEAIQNYKVTVLFVVPPLVVFLGKHPLVTQYDLSSIRDIRCGAAPLSKEVQFAAQERLRLEDIKQGYGMTELSIACVIVPPGVNKIGSSGVVAPGMDCKIIDINTGKALPPYKEGELCFKGPFVMKGYRDNPKATAETIDSQGWLHTGDIGYYDDEGFLFIVDRLKELIKYKGFQVPPAELEALLLTHPGVKDAAVIGIPDEEAGELPLAFVVRQPDSTVTEQEIKSFVAGKVSAQKRLHGGVRFLNEVPKNPSGKILRRELRAMLQKSKSKL